MNGSSFILRLQLFSTLRYGKAGCQRRIVVIVYRARSTWVALVSRRLLPILGRLRRLRRASRKYGKKKGTFGGDWRPGGRGTGVRIFSPPLALGGEEARAERRLSLRPSRGDAAARQEHIWECRRTPASLHGDRLFRTTDVCSSLVLYDRPERGCWGGPRFQRSRLGIA